MSKLKCDETTNYKSILKKKKNILNKICHTMFYYFKFRF